MYAHEVSSLKSIVTVRLFNGNRVKVKSHGFAEEIASSYVPRLDIVVLTLNYKCDISFSFIRMIVARTTKPVARRPKGAAVTATEQHAVATATRVEVDTRRGNDLLTISQAPHSLPEDIFNDSLTGDG